jgi:hypothetical protein
MSNFFENRVLEAVAPVLNSGERAEFFADSGCLFLECGLTTLSKIVRTLSKIGCGNFKVSHCGDEFAIDFI